MGLLGKLTLACWQYLIASQGHILSSIMVHSERWEGLRGHVTSLTLLIFKYMTPVSLRNLIFFFCSPLSTLMLMWKLLFFLFPLGPLKLSSPSTGCVHTLLVLIVK